jgi:Ran GTPase-activating protein (RanGAP) involved in mRNA processing and transport
MCDQSLPYRHNSQFTTDITDIGWQSIFAALLSSRLEKLNLHSNNMNEKAVTSLSDALLHNTTMKTLNLEGNRIITLAGWNAIFRLLRNPNFALEELHLRCNHITDEGLANLANALETNSRLRELDLGSNNDVTDAG